MLITSADDIIEALRAHYQAEALRAKWKTNVGQLSFETMLAELCGFLALSSKDNARKYFDFWNPILSRGEKN